MADLPLPFLLFAATADHDDRVTAREVTCFQDLLADTAWCGSAWMREQLAVVQADYKTCWKRYGSAGEDRLSACAIALQAAAGLQQGDQLAMLQQDCGTLVDRLEQAAGWRRSTGAAAVRDLIAQHLVLQPGGRATPTAAAAAPASAATAPERRAQRTGPADLPPVLATRPDGQHLPQPWTPGRQELTCVAVIDETADAKTFRFADPSGRCFAYRPGQFVTLALPIDGRTVRRSYTISSSPSRPHLLAITVKRVPGGVVSNWLHDHLRPGDSVTLRGPSGDFCIDTAPSERLLLASAGSGITPCMSMLRWFADTAAPVDVVFVHGAQRPDAIIYHRELTALAAAHPNLRIVLTCSRIGMGDAWTGYRGRVDLDLIRHAAPDLLDRTWFVCGPGPFMAQLRDAALAAGVPVDHYHEESFGDAGPAAPTTGDAPAVIDPTSQPAPQALPASVAASEAVAAAPAGHQVRFSNSGITATAAPDDPLLDVAEDAGVAIPNSCRSGSCGSCKVRLLSGEVAHEEGTCLDEAERADGWVLTCSCFARGPVELEA